MVRAKNDKPIKLTKGEVLLVDTLGEEVAVSYTERNQICVHIRTLGNAYFSNWSAALRHLRAEYRKLTTSQARVMEDLIVAENASNEHIERMALKIIEALGPVNRRMLGK